MKYFFKKIEPKWQAKWEESKVFEAKDNSDKPKFYGLVEFPYHDCSMSFLLLCKNKGSRDNAGERKNFH